MKRTLVGLMMMITIVAVAHSSYAQEGGPLPTRIVVNVAAPIYIQPDAKLVPLRTAAVGSMLNVQIGEGGWYRVEFQDPQYGRRVGYVEKRFVSGVAVRPESADLTVAEARPAQLTMAAQVSPNTPSGSSQTVSGFRTREVATQLQGETSSGPRGYVIGRSGMTFGTRTAPLIGAEVGGQIAPFLQAFGSVDWHRDISPSFVDDIGEFVSYIVDADVNYRFPTFTGVGGLKVIAPRGTIRPYGLGGLGYGRVNGTVEVEGEDVTELFDEFGFLDRDDISFNKMLFEVGGGISIVERSDVYGHRLSVSQVLGYRRADQHVRTVCWCRCRLLSTSPDC